jgi:hypothetical protein
LIDRELHLPTSWIEDRERCTRAGIPEAVGFATKPQLGIAMLARPMAPACSHRRRGLAAAAPVVPLELRDAGVPAHIGVQRLLLGAEGVEQVQGHLPVGSTWLTSKPDSSVDPLENGNQWRGACGP